MDSAFNTLETEKNSPTCQASTTGGEPCSLSVDMILESSDGLRFGVHSAYLSQYSRAFPPTNVIRPSKLEICTLPERSEELQLLMEFLHPGPLPNIRDVPIEILARLAEAAEKYLVYSAMQSCVLAMELRVKENPLLVLSHAMKHGYTHLQDVACPLTIDKSLAEGDKYLSIDRSFRIWALWRDDYREVKRVIMDEKPDCNAPGALKFYNELVSMFEKEGMKLSGSEMYQRWTTLCPPPTPAVNCVCYWDCPRRARDFMAKLEILVEGKRLGLSKFI